jgi:ATP-dependent exoDNAse (exonuclease V) beta subunit
MSAIITAPQAHIAPSKLAIENHHPRDDFIEFFEEDHRYTVHGEGGYTSVTTWNHSHFSHFDAEKIIKNILKSAKMKDPTYKYYGMTKESILQSWDTNRDTAAQAGTNMHYDIECYYNGIDNHNESIEFQYFKNFLRDFADLKPYRTEWCVYYEEYKLSGSIDMVFENPDGTLLIYDWKRVKEISYESSFNKYATTPCIQHMPDTNFWHYSLQLNVYKKILEDKYDKKVVGMYLVCLHPDNLDKSYERLEVPVLENDINNLFEFRKKQLEALEGI